MKKSTSERTTAIGDFVQTRKEKAIPMDHPHLPYIGLENVESHTTRLLEVGSAGEMRSAANVFKKGDVLYSRLRPYLNKVWVADRDGLCSSEFIVLPENDKVLGRFLCYRLNSAEFVRFANSLNTGDRPRVNFQQISAFRTILPPLAVQQEIVSELERQFTHLDAGVETLRRIQRNLRRYRAAVLKAACDCTLVPTEAEIAKQENRAYETGKEFLTHILDERRKQWPGRGRYSEPAVPEVAGLRPLPNGWTWATVEQLTTKVRNGVSTKPTATSGMPILRISAVRPNSVNLLEVRYLSGTEKAYSDFVLETGDVLFTRYNGNPDFVGVCGVVPLLNQKIVHPDKLIRCVPAQGLPPSFLCFMANTGESRKHISALIRTTAGQCGISGSDIKRMPIPLPPLAEQTRIVAEVERRLSIVDEVERIVTANLRRAGHLKQSILKQAFG